MERGTLAGGMCRPTNVQYIRMANLPAQRTWRTNAFAAAREIHHGDAAFCQNTFDTVIIIYLIAKGEPGALLGHGNAAGVVVDCGVGDVREHVIGSDDVTMGIRASSPVRNAR